MRKKLVMAVILLLCLESRGLFSKQPALIEECPFCDSAVLDRQKFYEDEHLLALYTHKPALPGHCLIIPKRHVERFEMLTDEEVAQIGKVVKKVDRAVMQVFETASYLLLQKNGVEVGQSIPHVHIHYIPRKARERSMLQLISKIYKADAKRAIQGSEMAKIIGEMKEALD